MLYSNLLDESVGMVLADSFQVNAEESTRTVPVDSLLSHTEQQHGADSYQNCPRHAGRIGFYAFAYCSNSPQRRINNVAIWALVAFSFGARVPSSMPRMILCMVIQHRGS